MDRRTIEKDIGFAESQIASHVLEPVQESGPLTAWYLRPAGGGRLMAALIIRHPEGLTIKGDIASSGYSTGYGLDWFVRELSPSYVAETFLKKDYSGERATQFLAEIIDEAKTTDRKLDPDDLEELERIAEEQGESIDSGTWDQEVIPFLPEDWDYEGLYPPADYPHSDVMWLAAIQRTFRRLFWERYESIADGGTLVLKSSTSEVRHG